METIPDHPGRFDALIGLAWCQSPQLPGKLRALRKDAGLNIDAAAHWIGKDQSTLRRMERGLTRVCLASARLLGVLGGTLPFSAWHGWCVCEDRLQHPFDLRITYTQSELAGVRYAWNMAAEARATLRRLGVAEKTIQAQFPYGLPDKAKLTTFFVNP